MITITINNLISGLKPRKKEIIAGRFGLAGGEPKTLAALGDKYGITRERTRQIEAEALREIRERILKEKSLKENILNPINAHLEGFGGLRRSDFFIKEARSVFGDEEISEQGFKFLAEVIGEPHYHENEHFYSLWHSGKESLERARLFLKDLEKAVAAKKEEILNKENFDFYFEKIAADHNLSDFKALNYLSISRKFHLNPFGDVGLSYWDEINPRTIGKKVYLILRKHGRPMHFTEVAETINRAGFADKQKALPETVHNELIKDSRIILVGRGTYGLKEHGYLAGTCREVIAEILKKAKYPLGQKEIIDSIIKQKILKPNTVILNLQNKRYFKKLPDGKFILK